MVRQVEMLEPCRADEIMNKDMDEKVNVSNDCAK